MREYSYQATDASIEVLRRLKAPWLTAVLTPRSLVVTTAEAEMIRLSAERAEVEPLLEAVRLRADRMPLDDGNQEPGDPVAIGDLTLGRNDVVLFTGETWAEAPPAHGSNGGGASAAQTLQMSGRAGQRPPLATAVCTTTDAIVVAAATGEGMLIRLGVRPMTIDVVTERATIARFLVQRGYSTE